MMLAESLECDTDRSRHNAQQFAGALLEWRTRVSGKKHISYFMLHLRVASQPKEKENQILLAVE